MEWNCALHRLLKAITRFGRAAINSASRDLATGIATGPTQEERRSERKNNRLSAEVRLDAYALCRGWQGKGKALAKDHRVGPVFPLTDHVSKYFGLQQKRCRVGPIAG